MSLNRPILGIIGAGRLGTTLARAALSADYTVNIANSKDPVTLQLIASVMFPAASLKTAADVIAASDIVILAIPLSKFSTLPPAAFLGKIVIDAMNYWPSTEGRLAEFEAGGGSSELIQAKLPQATVVKALNHVAYHELLEHSLPPGSAGRRAVALAGDDPDAKRLVEGLIDALGFDPLDIGSLSEGTRLQPGGDLFNHRFTQR